jgi:lipopolysaccharide transport system permease protein
VPTLLGLGWALVGTGCLLRDLGEIVGLFMGMMLFLTPVFFPLSVLPDFLQVWVQFNPLAIPIEALRQHWIDGDVANFVGLFCSCLGWAWVALLVLGCLKNHARGLQMSSNASLVSSIA